MKELGKLGALGGRVGIVRGGGGSRELEVL